MPLRLPLLLAALLAPSLVLAQAWTQEPGRVYLKITQGFANASERYDAAGEVVPYDPNATGTPFRDRSLYLYGEVGLAERLTLFGTLPYKRLYVRDGGVTPEVEREAADLGSATLGLRIGLEEAVGLDERSALAANVGFGIPLGYRRNVAPAVGPGQVDLQALVAYGRSFWPRPAYAQAALGYRHRTAVFDLSRIVACPPSPPEDAPEVCVPMGGAEIAYSDEILATLEAGYTLRSRLLVQALLDVVWSVERPEEVETVLGLQPEAFPARRVVRTGLGATLYLFDETGLSVQVFTAPYARNALRAVELFVGVETKL